MQVHWLRVILDEGHMLGASLQMTNKLSMAINLRAERRWIMTGMPPVQRSAISTHEYLAFGLPVADRAFLGMQVFLQDELPQRESFHPTRMQSLHVELAGHVQGPPRPARPPAMWLTCTPCSASWGSSPTAPSAASGRWAADKLPLLSVQAPLAAPSI